MNAINHTDNLKQQMYNYAKQLNYPKALAALSQLMQAGYENADVIYDGARYSFAMRNYQQSYNLAEKTLSLSPIHPGAQILKGRIFLTLNHLHEALSTFDSVIAYCKLTENQKYELREILTFFFKNHFTLLQNQYKNLFIFMTAKAENGVTTAPPHFYLILIKLDAP